MFAFEYFTKKETTTVVEYNTEWANSTGYLDGVVTADLGLEPGQLAKCTDDKGRRMLINGTPFGNIVVFERYMEDPDTLVSNMPNIVQRLTGITGALNEDNVTLLVGMNNIGKTLVSVENMFKIRESKKILKTNRVS